MRSVGLNLNDFAKDFYRLHHLAMSDHNAARKMLKQMQGNYPDNPAISFIELVIILATDNMSLFPKKVEVKYGCFPDDPLIRIMHDILSDSQTTSERGFRLIFFGQRKTYRRIFDVIR